MRANKKKSFRVWLGNVIPEYAWCPLIFEFTLNMLVYTGAKVIARSWKHFDLTTELDRRTPFLPWTIVIYFSCYLFWCVNYVLSVRENRERTWRFLSADFLAKLVCLACFLAIPTTNARPEIVGHTIWEELMRFLYWIDSPDNLFPSIHCLTSWFCYIGIRKREDVPRWYRTFSCLFAVAVFVSTLTTKQHVIADVAGGVALAEISYWIAGRTALSDRYGCTANRINARLFEKR